MLPDLPFGTSGAVAMILLLVFSGGAMPFAEFARRNKLSPLSDYLAGSGFIAMGFFSSLLILTLLRDVALIAAFAASGSFIDVASLPRLQAWSAAAVPAIAAFMTIAGFVNARRRARVRHVDVPIAGLPSRLHGSSIVQISDIHVGSTICGSTSAAAPAIGALPSASARRPKLRDCGSCRLPPSRKQGEGDKCQRKGAEFHPSVVCTGT